MSEQFCDVGRGVTLCYETFGEPADPPIVLIMGLATQMIAWNDEYCRSLAERGFYVVRFDNRDIGHSTHFDFRAPSMRQLVSRRFGPEQYDLGDMAEDTYRLIRELELDPAHVVGASMGGMIAQTLAARNPEAVRSLVSIMSTTGSRRVGNPAPQVYRSFLAPRPSDPEELVEMAANFFALIGSPPPNQDLDRLRAMTRLSVERNHDRWAGARQLGAILKSGNRTRELRRITAPTLVIHGNRDRLINVSGGRATARAIPGAKLVVIDGMGHDLPKTFWPRLRDAIVEHAKAAGAEAGSELAAPGVGRSAGD
jgi:pimeloyl-ACP methyl ester carboxylesterase